MFHAIHIFSSGDVQYISDSVNYIAKRNLVTTIQAVIADVKSKKPENVEEEDFSIINIFPDRVSYVSSKKSSYSFPFNEINKNLINAMEAEVQNLASTNQPTNDISPITL